jgi:hypothetical protein
MSQGPAGNLTECHTFIGTKGLRTNDEFDANDEIIVICACRSSMVAMRACFLQDVSFMP